MSVQIADNKKTTVAEMLSSVGEIATLPEVTVKIIDVVENPNGTARDLQEVIKTDPVLSAKVLKVVNSAFYGLPGQVDSVDRATVLLGGAAIKNISITASLVRMFDGKHYPNLFHAKDLWRHCVAVGVAARGIARCAGHSFATDEIFMAGLIHDLGLLVVRQAVPRKLAEVCRQCEQRAGDFLQLEEEHIGATHQDLGEALATQWRFPKHLRAAVGFHHNPEMLPDELQLVPMILRCADILCCQQQLGFSLLANEEAFPQAVLDAAGVTVDQLNDIRETLVSELKEAEAVFGSND